MTLSNWCESKLLRFFIHKANVHCVVCGLAVFAVYWGIPFLFSIFDDTLLTEHGEKVVRELVPPLAGAGAFPKPLTSHPPGLKLAYLEDKTHLLFALFLVPAAMIFPVILRGINRCSNRLLEDHVIPESLLAQQTYDRFKALANHQLGRVFSLSVAVTAFFLFFGFHLNPRFSYWWGSSQYGLAGLGLAIIEFLMVYFGTQAIIYIALGAIVIGHLVRINPKFHPFHHDGCSGFSPVGHLIMMLWLFAICLAAEIYVATKFGYLDLELNTMTWILAVTGLVALPLIAIYPLYHCAQALYSLKLRELKELEPSLIGFYADAKHSATEHQYANAAKSADNANSFVELHKYILEVSIWPFDTRAFSVVVAIYTVQCYLTMHELIAGR